MAVFNDITELKQAQTDRDLQQKRLELLTESAAQVTNALQEGVHDDEPYLRTIAEVFHCEFIVQALCVLENSIHVDLYHFPCGDTAQHSNKTSYSLTKQEFSQIPCESLFADAIWLPELPSLDPRLKNIAIGGMLHFVGDNKIRSDWCAPWVCLSFNSRSVMYNAYSSNGGRNHQNSAPF